MHVLFSVSECLQYPRRKGKSIQAPTHTAEALPKSLAPLFTSEISQPAPPHAAPHSLPSPALGMTEQGLTGCHQLPRPLKSHALLIPLEPQHLAPAWLLHPPHTFQKDPPRSSWHPRRDLPADARSSPPKGWPPGPASPQHDRRLNCSAAASVTPPFRGCSLPPGLGRKSRSVPSGTLTAPHQPRGCSCVLPSFLCRATRATVRKP